MDAAIKKIIKTDKDRLFTVDPECIIIYTGDSLDDEKPFIRIGNWINLPVELIPLIENIVVPDRTLGTPSYEQFNIDVRQLASNRYIGSEKILERYLDFQKIFGLDLTNAAIVNIEKDIPEISKEKNLTSKNHFIGVFYRDGNFKTVHNNNPIVDLKKYINSAFMFEQAHNELSDANKKSTRFSGSGLVLTGHNPMFFHNRDFASYQFPIHYFEDFSLLGIDPKRIKVIVHPSVNYINISKFIKWKHITGDNIRIFSDHTHIINLFKNLFPKCNIIHDNFSSMNYNSGDGLSIKNYPGSYNLRLNFRNSGQSKQELAIAYVKGTEGIQSILKDKLDAICISYSAFEDTNLLFKSATTPILIIDDGNKNLAKLHQQDKQVLFSGAHYEFLRFEDYDSLESAFDIDSGIKTAIIDNSFTNEKLEQYLSGNESQLSKHARAFNLLSFITLQADYTTDRKHAARLLDAHKKIKKDYSYAVIKDTTHGHTVNIVFYDNHAYLMMPGQNTIEETCVACDTIQEDTVNRHKVKSKTKTFYSKIIEDRKRLMQLLDYLWTSTRYTSEYAEDVTELAKAIEYRKESFLSDSLSIEIDDLYNENGELIHTAYSRKKNISNFMEKISNAAKGFTGFEHKDDASAAQFNTGSSDSNRHQAGIIQKLFGKTDKNKPLSEEPASHITKNRADTLSHKQKDTVRDSEDNTNQSFIRRRKKIVISAAAIILAALTALLLTIKLFNQPDNTVSNNNQNQTNSDNINVTASGIDNPPDIDTSVNETRKSIDKKTYDSINVTDQDIYHYANRIAKKNGYAPIPYKQYGKDPDWIYPGNVFTMHDGEKITVVKGDTLWGLAKKKLVMMSLRFDNVVKEYKDTDDAAKKRELLQTARGFIFTKRNKTILETLSQESNNGQ